MMFSEMMQQIVNDLTAGTTKALIICVYAQGSRESFRNAACFGGARSSLRIRGDGETVSSGHLMMCLERFHNGDGVQHINSPKAV